MSTDSSVTAKTRSKSTDKPNPTKRRAVIANILSKYSTLSQNELAGKLKNEYGITVEQATISKDLKSLGATKTYVKEEVAYRYKLPPRTKEAIYESEIVNLCAHASINATDIRQITGMFAIKTKGYTFPLADKLKQLYGDAIIEVICLENSAIVCYDKNKGNLSNKLGKLISQE